MTPERERLIVSLWGEKAPRLRLWLKGQAGADGEDLVLDTFIKLLVIEDDPSERLMWTLALNLLTDYRRRAAGRPDPFDLTDDGEGRQGSAHSFATEDVASFRADFDRAFRSLPRGVAEAFALTDMRGLTEREAADVLGVSQMTVNRRATTARSQLQEALS